MALLGQLMHRRKGLVFLGIVASAFKILVSLWWNAQLSGLINFVNQGISVPARALTLAGGTVLLSAFTAYAFDMLSGYACETMAHDLRTGYARHFTRLPLPEIEALGAGETLSKLQNEIAEVANFLRNQLLTLVDDALRFFGTFFWLLWLNPQLTICIHLPVVFIMMYTAYSSKAIESAARESQRTNAEMGGFADTLVQLFPILRAFDAGALLTGKYQEALSRWKACGIREERTRARLMSLSAVLSFLPLLCILGIGGMQVIRGEMSLGMLYIFINLSGNTSGVLGNMPGRIAAFRRFCVNMERLHPSVHLNEGGWAHGHHD